MSMCALAQQMPDEGTSVLAYIRRAMRYSQFYPQEKVYLHLDNTGYFMGETMWFKAYVTRTDTEQATDLSSVLYVELLNPSGDVVLSRKLHVENGVAHGDIKVDSLMVTGFYEIRAYTRYMTNWGTNACFSRVIPIFKRPRVEGGWANPEIDQISYRHRLNNERLDASDLGDDNIFIDESQEQAKERDNRPGKVRFYPEGGNIVEGLPCRVAYMFPQAEKNQFTGGEGDSREGKDTSNAGSDRGTLTLAAEDSHAKATIGGKAYDLPKAKASGSTLMLDIMDDDEVTVDVYSTPDIQGRLMGYVIVNNGRIVRCDTMTIADHNNVTLERAKLREGTNTITFFDSNGQVLAERLFFIYPQTRLEGSLTATATNTTLKPCGKVTFDIQSEPNTQLSFSAVDARGMLNERVGNIQTWMLLASDLRGYIAHPEYYLEADDAEHRRATDLLMLTQGWRRYDWRMMSGHAMFEKFENIENQLYLFGQLKQKTKKQDVAGVWLDAKLFNMSGQVVEGTTQTDSLGGYVFKLPDVSGEWALSLNTGVADKKGYWKDVNYYVCIDRNFSPAPRYVSSDETAYVAPDDTRSLKWKFTPEDEQWVSITHKEHVLKTVVVKAKGRVWDRTGWGDESSARRHSLIYYNCDTEADRIADNGEPMPFFCDWLKQKNSFFDGASQPTNILMGLPIQMSRDIKGHCIVDSSERSGDGRKLVVDLNEYDPMHKSNLDVDPENGYVPFFGDGLTYKNRPVVWIVDNQFRTITDFRRKSNASTYVLGSSGIVHGQEINILTNDKHGNVLWELPDGLDDVISVYVSEDLEALHGHILCEDIDAMNPVVVYVYTHRKFNYKQKGVRMTHFMGYNEPSVFQMEDYATLPPLEDYRRTLFWAPEVTTDANGKATIEFWNNSACTEMFISCEGMTPEGRFVAK